MRLGIALGSWGMDPDELADTARLAEDLGYDQLWFGEAYGADVAVPLTWVAARTSRIGLGAGVFLMDARTPAMTAMTAMTLDNLSGGRLICGLGASGPQVVEGWHGRPYGKPLAKTREYVSVLRQIWAGEDRVRHAGEQYRIPYDGPDATGLGRAIRPIQKGRPDIPIYLAAQGPRNVALATEVADGFIPFFWSPEHWHLAFGEALASVDLDRFDVAANVLISVGDDLDRCRDAVRPDLALYLGGMGARGRNFYNDVVSRFGFGDVAGKIQDAYLDGRRDEAAALVPDALIDELTLVGPPGRVADRLAAWAESPVGTVIINASDEATLRAVAAIR